MKTTNRTAVLVGLLIFVCIGALLWYINQSSKKIPNVFESVGPAPSKTGVSKLAECAEFKWVPFSSLSPEDANPFISKNNQIWRYRYVIEPGNGLIFVSSSSPDSFELAEDSFFKGTYVFQKDTNQAYYEGYIIPGADPSTFRVDGLFAKDKNHIYTVNHDSVGPPIVADLTVTANGATINPDPRTFVSFCEPNGSSTGYSKDKNHTYYTIYVNTHSATSIVLGADSATFEAVDDPTYTIDARDKNHTYNGGQVVK